MKWSSTRFWTCLAGMSLTQWALVAHLITEHVWMSVMMVCLGAFGLAKTAEYAKGKQP